LFCGVAPPQNRARGPAGLFLAKSFKVMDL
jgi:hypothetical protein